MYIIRTFLKKFLLLYIQGEEKMDSFKKIERYCFALAHYTKMSLEEKWILIRESFNDNEFIDRDYKVLDQQKKLSAQKKASFFEFEADFEYKAVQFELKQKDISWCSFFEETYPKMLREIYLPPLLLFYKGNIDWLNRPAIGVVGARLCSDYGKAAIQSLLPELIQNDIIVCSGLAKGIDAEAHRQTILNNGKTIAVIGTGIDRSYPISNRRLQDEIGEHHLLISEFPAGTKPLKHHFPLRNRIISGISQGVMVIEAKKRSGSLITAFQALEQDREVFAVPGPIFSPVSAGTNELIKSGAKMVTSAQDILEEYPYIRLKK